MDSEKNFEENFKAFRANPNCRKQVLEPAAATVNKKGGGNWS